MKGNTGLIEVELQLDPTLKLDDGRTEKYAGILSKVDWKFMVTEVKEDTNHGGGSGGGGGGGSRDRTPNLVNIPDSEVPLSDMTTIEDSPVPLGMIPRTGDETPLIPIIVTVLGSGMILLYLANRMRKEREEGNVDTPTDGWCRRWRNRRPETGRMKNRWSENSRPENRRMKNRRIENGSKIGLGKVFRATNTA